MTFRLLAAAMAVGVGVAGMAAASSVAVADESGRYREQRQYERKAERRYVTKQRKYRDDSYAARANDLDPAGDYKGYPDWARVALSPKFDRGWR